MGLLTDLFRRRAEAHKRQVQANMVALRDLFQDEARRELSRPYPRASRVGEAPARRSGTLQGGAQAIVHLSDKGGTVTLINPTSYAEELRRSGRVFGGAEVFRRLERQRLAIIRRGMPFGGK